MVADRFKLFDGGSKKCTKVVVLILVLLGLGLSAYVVNNSDIIDSAYTQCQSYALSTENVGVTSANIRLYSETQRKGIWAEEPWLFDLSQVESYHEFVYLEENWRFILTTEVTVYEFIFFEVEWNENRWIEDEEVYGERRYNVVNILHSMEKLTPEIPFVVVGGNLGCAVSRQGFSFVDEKGMRRYFVIRGGMADFEPPIFAVEF